MLIRKTIALLLSPILIWASMGFSLSQHYCLGVLVEEHLYHDGASCEFEMVAEESCHEDSTALDQVCTAMNGCCKDVWIQVDQVQIVSLLDAPSSIILPNFALPSSSISFTECYLESNSALNASQFKPPPLNSKGGTEYLIALQRFLI